MTELTPEQYQETLDASFEGVLQALRGIDNTAKVGAAAEIIERSEDKTISMETRLRWTAHKEEARQELLEVVKDKMSKEPARLGASRILTRILKENAPASWPPDQRKAKWRNDLIKAETACGLKHTQTTKKT